MLGDWWKVDRIRISPYEGQLLRLPLPCLIQIEGENIQVIRRRVGYTEEGAFVDYDCQLQGNQAILSVDPVSFSLGRTARLTQDGKTLEVPEDEVIVFG